MGEPSEAGLSPSPLRLLPQVALETLLLRGPQKPQTHPLTDYRYTGDCSQVPRGFCPAETPRASQPRGHALLVPPPAAPAFPAGPVVSGATGAGGGALNSSGWVLPSPCPALPVDSAQPGGGCCRPGRGGGGWVSDGWSPAALESGGCPPHPRLAGQPVGAQLLRQ